jgi:phage-related protein
MPHCFQVILYEKENGTRPAYDFLQSLDKRMRVRMDHTIRKLVENGHELREPFSKHIGDGIFELRAKVGTDISRVMYFFIVGERVVLTSGFIKKMQKTPRAEIERAKRYRKDFLLREEKTNDDI